MNPHSRIPSPTLILTAERSPAVLARIAGVLARLDVMPARLACAAADDGRLVVEIEIDALADAHRRRLEDLLAGLVDVIALVPAAPVCRQGRAPAPVLAVASPMR